MLNFEISPKFYISKCITYRIRRGQRRRKFSLVLPQPHKTWVWILEHAICEDFMAAINEHLANQFWKIIITLKFERAWASIKRVVHQKNNVWNFTKLSFVHTCLQNFFCEIKIARIWLKWYHWQLAWNFSYSLQSSFCKQVT